VDNFFPDSENAIKVIVCRVYGLLTDAPETQSGEVAMEPGKRTDDYARPNVGDALTALIGISRGASRRRLPFPTL